MWYHELPAFSPLPTGAVLSSLAAFSPGNDDLEVVRSLIAAEFAAPQAILLDSGRSALTLALEIALARRSPRIVAMPSFQCYEVATAVVGADCQVAPYDIDPATLTPDLSALEAALRRGASVVIVAPLYGLPVNWEAITTLVSRYGARVIEDAAQAHGAEWGGRRVGTLGEFSVLSFGRGKGWTGAGGGALLLRGAAADANVRIERGDSGVRIAATAIVQLLLGRPKLYGLPASVPGFGLGQTVYREPSHPRGMATFSAALVRRTLGPATHEAHVRRRNAERWREDLPSALASAAPEPAQNSIAGFLRFPLLAPEACVAGGLPARARRAGIARSYPRPLQELPQVHSRLVRPAIASPGASVLARRLVTLPTHSRLTPAARNEILDILQAWSAHARPVG